MTVLLVSGLLFVPAVVVLPTVPAMLVLPALPAQAAEPPVLERAPALAWRLGSIVLPCGFSKEGLPIGLQLTAQRWGDAKLLGVAKALEKLLPPCPVPPNYA